MNVNRQDKVQASTSMLQSVSATAIDAGLQTIMGLTIMKVRDEPRN